MKWLDKLERKFSRRFGIPELMLYVSIAMVCIFAFEYFFGFPATQLFSLNRDAIFHGEIWRLLTFLVLPSGGNPLTLLITVYFYYFLGTTLERTWGVFRFNLYYLFGVIGAIAAMLITGYASNLYLNLSLFLAFAMLFPEQKVMLFFIIPIKIKYLALVDWIFFAISFFTGGWSTKAAILFSILNFLIFFGPDFFNSIRNFFRYRKQRQSWNTQNNKNPWR